MLFDMFPEYPADRLRGFANKFVMLFARAIYKWVQRRCRCPETWIWNASAVCSFRW